MNASRTKISTDPQYQYSTYDEKKYSSKKLWLTLVLHFYLIY